MVSFRPGSFTPAPIGPRAGLDYFELIKSLALTRMGPPIPRCSGPQTSHNTDHTMIIYVIFQKGVFDYALKVFHTWYIYWYVYDI